MADTHENGDFLLQAVDLGLLPRPSADLKLFDRISDTSRLFYAQINRSEVSFAQLLLHSVLLLESVCVAFERVSENIATLVEDGNFVAFVQFTALVASNEGVVHKGSIAGQIFEHSNGISAFLLGE